MARGLFITFEGNEGSGKSTQLRLLQDRLMREGYPVTVTVEPGGTPIGIQIRRILLDSANEELRPVTELLLMFASRAQNVEQVIRPALASGRIVLCDRFTDSTLAYQGAARGLGREVVDELDRIACQGLTPDLTLFIDADLETGLARAMRRNERNSGEDETRLDAQSIEFHSKVREAYLQLAIEEPVRFRRIDGSADPERVAKRVWEAVESSLAGVRREGS
jgi:dTMP kinase